MCDLKARFHRVPAPTDDEVAAVLKKITHKVIRLLQKHGVLTEAEEIDPEQIDLLIRSEPLLTTCIGASVEKRVGVPLGMDGSGVHVQFLSSYSDYLHSV